MQARSYLIFDILIIYLIILNLNKKVNKTLVSATDLVTCKLPTTEKELLIVENAITAEEISLGSEVPQNSLLIFTCKTGYNLKGWNQTVCDSNGRWTKTPPECVSLCTDHYPRSGFSTQAYFELAGTDVSRAKQFEQETIAKISCAEGFYKESFFDHQLICKEDGWLGKKFPCKMQCGQPIAPITPYSQGGVDVNITEVPWHVGIYKLENGAYENICGGVLISPRIVVTAAHCFFEFQRTKEMNDFTKYSVAAGKYYREYNNDREPKIATIEIRKITDVWTPEDYTGRKGTLFGDIAIIKLDQFIPFSETIRPACLLPYEEARPKEYDSITGKLSSWSQSNFREPYSVLKTFLMSVISSNSCNETIREQFQYELPTDKICVAPYDSRAFACKGDSGSGFVVKLPNTNEYILQGIVSFSPKPTQLCSHDNLLILTNVFYYHRILEQYKTDDLEDDVEGFKIKTETKKFCELKINTNFMIIRDSLSNKRLSVDDKIPGGTSVIFACEEGYELAGESKKTCYSYTLYEKGQWDYPLPTCIPKTCKSKSMVCRLFNECPDYSQVTSSNLGKLEWCHRSQNVVCCPRNRPFEKACEKWRESVYAKNPCDFWILPNLMAIFPKRFPHMALVGTYEDFKYNWFCGGSLISPKFVLTTAKCITKRIPNRIRLGEINYNSTIDATFQEELTTIKNTTDGAYIQEFGIKNSIPHPKYKTTEDYFDIALIELDGKAIINEYVVPICLPSSTESARFGVYGGGYGLLHDRILHSQINTTATHLLVDRLRDEKCKSYKGSSALPNDLNFTSQFCAQTYTNSEKKCYRDTGGALFFDHLYYRCMHEIHGITSFNTSDCDSNNLPDVATSVFPYVNWIESIVWNNSDFN